MQSPDSDLDLELACYSKYFCYDKIFNLLDYDRDMLLLFNELKQLKKSHYDHNYRFIFYHWDTDYYLTNDIPGFTLRNLQRILANLDIPNYFCLIVTQQNIDNELEQLRIEEAPCDPFPISSISTKFPISSISTGLQNFHIQEPNNVIGSNVDKVFISLTGRQRHHRLMVLSLLKHKNLLDKGIVSYGTT